MFQAKTVIPGSFAVAAQPAQQDLTTLAEQGNNTLINNRPDNEAQSQPKVEAMRSAAAKHGLDYIHIPVTIDTISKRDIDLFR